MELATGQRMKQEQDTEALPRPEYPRPQFVRDQWLCLNGKWDFVDDVDNVGLRDEWFATESTAFSDMRQIIVPFCPESALSGIGDTGYHDVVWYRRSFTVPGDWQGEDIHLHIGAADYETRVWVNGQSAGYHQGGYTPIAVDITPYLNWDGPNVLTIRVEDQGANKEQPRGKQDWLPESHNIWYTRCSGIWQSVWIEPVPANHIADIRMVPDLASCSVTVQVRTSRLESTARISVEAQPPTLRGVTSGQDWTVKKSADISGGVATLTLVLPEGQSWSPEHPHLHPVTIRLATPSNPLEGDVVQSYFGLRSVERNDGMILLNGEPYFLKMVLDQGYWPDGIYTAPTDDAIRFDIESAKKLGFNGARKHQKVEDPRWLYWADTLGLVTWGEMGNAYGFSLTSRSNFLAEWPSVVARDINHPCIITWVPFNESWGLEGIRESVEIQQFLRDVIAQTRALDPTRLVIGNDGWEHINETDIVGLHDYEQDAEKFYDRWAHVRVLGHIPSNFDGIVSIVQGQRYNGQPVMMSEYGGIAFKADVGSIGTGWGYGEAARQASALLTRFEALTSALLRIPGLAGYCYTQLYDVEQEINGLLTYDRAYKVDPERIAACQGVRQLPDAASALPSRVVPHQLPLRWSATDERKEVH